MVGFCYFMISLCSGPIVCPKGADNKSYASLVARCLRGYSGQSFNFKSKCKHHWFISSDAND